MEKREKLIKELIKKIKKYDRIIIHRHSRPDLDALGTQLGLRDAIKYNFPNKEVYVVGDVSAKYKFIGDMDEIDDSKYEGALAIIVDVAVSHMVSDERYKLAKEVFVVDHHNNECDVTENWICDPDKAAVAEYITMILKDNHLKINKDAATKLFGGIVTDSGRFMYGHNRPDTLKIAAYLLECGADDKFIYSNIYVESLKNREMTNYFSNKFEVKDGVAFLKNDKDVFEKFPVEFSDISRGMVGVMAGIEEIKIWLNFTYDVTKDAVVGEFRSRNINIVDIAKKYGGGGHLQACGATLKDWNEVDQIINDYIKLANE